MRVEAGSSHLSVQQRMQPTRSVERNGGTFFAVTLAAAGATKAGTAGAKGPDFTHMTRQELFDWMNGEIRGGRMSFEESTPFLAMTLKIPVASGHHPAMASLDGSERIDFVKKARDGIDGALSRQDKHVAKMLESALLVMRRYQEQARGVDIFA